jgi:serine/threonine-protein kinase
MVMDLLEGETLGARLRRSGQMPLQEIASYLVPVVSALGMAHSLGVVHRDLKPENIFLAGSEEAPTVTVLDFGIAKLTGDGGLSAPADSITSTGALLGTPCYMSPEQALGAEDIDHRTDIWSVGVILYEALAGARPVEGENLAQVVSRLVTDGIVPIEVLVPDLPEDLVRLIGRMLSQACDDRPEDLREVMAVLERHTGARAPAFGPPGSLPEASPAPPEAPAEVPGRARRPGWAVVAGSAALLGVSFFTLRSGEAEVVPRSRAVAALREGPGADERAPSPPSAIANARAAHAFTASVPSATIDGRGHEASIRQRRVSAEEPSSRAGRATKAEPADPPEGPRVPPIAPIAEDGLVDEPPF